MTLRPMTMDDADKMLEWKNYSETRLFSILTPQIITKENHYYWLRRNLEFFQIIQGTNNSIGAIRIKDNEISIWIDRAFWGQGIASRILKQVSTPKMKARILPGNIASIRSFLTAGFKPVHYVTNSPSYYIFEK